MIEPQVEIKQYSFTDTLFDDFKTNHYAKDLWPLVYILSDGNTKEAYVGETTDAYARMSAHLKNNSKSKLTSVHLITSEKFNKSATLDIESNLIKYLAGDGKFKLLNGNLGLANHNYYQKNEVYKGVFKSLWNTLRAEGISKHSLEHIDNSDLFKYSPYKTLTQEQLDGLFTIMQSLLSNNHKNILVEGGAGTGKTIMAIFLFKMFQTVIEDFNFQEFGDSELDFIELVDKLKKHFPDPKMALVVPMASFRETLKKVFRNVKGLKASMVIGPAEVAKNTYDILVVDEAHRLRRRVNLGAYFGAFDKACKSLGLDKTKCSELDWILKQSDKAILFYDEDQSIKPSDAKKEDFDALKQSEETKTEKLKSQFRVRGGNAYVAYVDKLLNRELNLSNKEFDSKQYEFVLFDSIEEMVNEIKLRDQEHGLSRLIAGYSWEWVSKKDGSLFDIKIEDLELKWNSSSQDWINSQNSVNEVGCIHTTQGYDLNYTGVIFGNEISYDKEKDQIIILKENYFDKNGKNSIEDPEELKEFIINIYKTIMLRGIKGTYVYVCDSNLRNYLSQFIPQKTKKREVTILPHSEVLPFENCIPLYDLKVAAGTFGNAQKVEDINWISLPSKIKPSEDLFACKIIGESMNKVIPNGAIGIFRKYFGGSRDGMIVLVELTDLQDGAFGSCYTIKEYNSKKITKENQWKHESITLKPLSSDPSFETIELAEEDSLLLKVIGIFECVL